MYKTKQDVKYPTLPELFHTQIAGHLSNILEQPETTSIAFVRNPYHRLVSFYRNRVIGMGSEANPKHTARTIPSDAQASFENFIHFACQTPNHMRDNHYALQWFMLNPGLKCFDFIGFTEQLSEHAYLCFSELGASPEVLATITDRKMHSSGTYHWKDYYNSTLAELVYNAYYPDFKAFGYHQDSWKKDHTPKYQAPLRGYDPQKDIETFRPFVATTAYTRV